MAERRMFAKTIIDSDAFLDMPSSAQALYFHLAMRADDDGFLNNPKKVQRTIGAADDDLKLLLAKRFILAFESGVIVIKHWRIHNYIRTDRYKPTVYTEEKAQLTMKENGAYTVGIPSDIPTVYQMKTQDRLELGKDRLGKDRLGDGIQTRARGGVDDDDQFGTFWAAYPVKSGDIRQAYFEYLGAIQSGVSEDEILEAVKWQAKAKDQRFFPSAEKWLRNKGWTEKPEASEKKRSAAFMSSGEQKSLSASDWDKVINSI